MCHKMKKGLKIAGIEHKERLIPSIVVRKGA